MSQAHELQDVESLRTAMRAGWRPPFLYFWGHSAKDANVGKHVLSQWWPASFEVDGQAYSTAEHYMMAEKARLFGDAKTRADILATTDPAQAKALGRKAIGFDEGRWAEQRVSIALQGNIAKFGQNADLKEWLVGTKDAVLVEASPVDRVWGIGLSADDERAANAETWRGLNLLGFVLMKVRAKRSWSHGRVVG